MYKERTQSKRKSFLTVVNGLFFLLFSCFTFMVPTTWAVPAIPAHNLQESLSLAPYLEVYVDVTGALAVEDIQNPKIQSKFTPFELGGVDIPKAGATLWLRFTLAGRDGQSAQKKTSYLLDMGSEVTPYTRLFVPTRNVNLRTIVWQEYSPSIGGVFLMPEQQNFTRTAYLKVDAMPSIWFSPVMRTPHNAATSLDLMAKPMAIMALGIVMLLCLLRGFTDRGQWRYWAGLYTAMAFLYAISGVPHGTSLSMKDLLLVLSPGLALILLPHVARHVMDTPQKSRTIDMQYMALSGVGVVVALLPLVPGFGWIMHYLELWPLLTLCFVPTTLAAWMSGFEGSRRFLLSCLLPPLGVAIGLLGLLPPVGFAIFSVATLPALPLWGIALGTLFMAGTASPSHVREEHESSVDVSVPTVESLVHSDPNLRLVPVEEAQSMESEAENSNAEEPKRAISKLEELLRWPVEQLNRDLAALEICALPVKAQESVASLLQVSRDINAILHAPARERMTAPSLGGTEEHIFDLQSLLRQAHDCVVPEADKKNVALSWFMPPQLAQCYKGDAMQLLYVLRLLLESSVRSTHRGAVQLAVRNVPESVNPGHLLFTITDTGTGKPPQERSVTALARAWELSATYRGFLGVESNAHGAAISFTVHCEVCTMVDREMGESAMQSTKKYPIILLSDTANDRQMWGFFLEKISHVVEDAQEDMATYTVLEARTSEEALNLYKEHSAALIIIDARMPLMALELTMRALYMLSQEHGEAFPLCLAMYATDSAEKPVEEEAFHVMGFAHVLALPVTKQRLNDEVQALLHDDEARKDPGEHFAASALGVSVEDEMPDGLEEEIIDTGIPILDLHGGAGATSTLPEPFMESFSPMISASQQEAEQEFLHMDGATVSQGKGSLSDAIFLVDDTHAPALTEQEAMEAEIHEALIEQEVMALQKPSYSAEEESLMDDLLQSAEAELMAEGNAMFSRPKPSEDKSNAAYLTSLLGFDAVPEKESMPEKGTILKKESILETDKDLVVPVVSAESLRPHGISKPRGTVPFEKHSGLGFSGGDTWIGEPMPIGSPVSTAISRISEGVRERNVHADDKKIMPAPECLNKEVESATQELREAVLREKSAKLSPVEFEPEVQKIPTPVFDHEEWVGEPMPLAAQVTDNAPEQSEEDPLSMTPLGAKAEEQLPELTFHRDEDAEKRGREEIGNLKGYIQKLLGKAGKKKAGPNLQESFLPPLSEVGEPMPLVRESNAVESILQENVSQNVSTSFEDELFTQSEVPAMSPELSPEKSPEKSSEELFEEALEDILQEVTPEKLEQEQTDFAQEEPKHIEDKKLSATPAQASSPFAWDFKVEEPATQTTLESQQPEYQPDERPEVHSGEQAEEQAGTVSETAAYADPAVELSPIEQLLVDVDTDFASLKEQLAFNDLAGVEDLAATLAGRAEEFGLRTLGRLARTVEAAAKAQDKSALEDLVPELDMSVQRNKAALQE